MPRRIKKKLYCEHCALLLQRKEKDRCREHRSRKKFPIRYCGYCARRRPVFCDGKECLPRVAPATVTEIYAIRRGATEEDRALCYVRVICAVRGITCAALMTKVHHHPRHVVLARAMAVYLCVKHSVPDEAIMSALGIGRQMLRRDKKSAARQMEQDELFQQSIARAEEIIQRQP